MCSFMQCFVSTELVFTSLWKSNLMRHFHQLYNQVDPDKKGYPIVLDKDFFFNQNVLIYFLFLN